MKLKVMSMPKNKVLTLLFPMIAFSFSVNAETVGDLKNIQRKTILLQAEAAQYKAQSERDEYKAKTQDPSGSSLGGDIPSLPASNMVQTNKGNPDDTVLPVVRAVFGANGKLTASLLYSSGARFEGAVGENIPGNYKIESISMDKVVVSRNGKNNILIFSKVAPHAASTTNSNSAFPSTPMPLR